MSVLLTADLHLTDNPRDAYRWQVFAELHTAIAKTKATHLVIAGDLTHHKDNHSNALINRLVDELYSLSLSAKVIVLVGNHDFTDPANPLLRMTRFVEGITFVHVPLAMGIDRKRWLFLPYSQDPATDWAILATADVVCFHQPVEGAVAGGGHTIAGVPASVFDVFGAELVIGGDVHKPQTINGVTYIGSPHPVSAGEDHAPRFVLVKGTKPIDVPLKTIKRATVKMRRVKSLSEYGFASGDQVRVRVELPAARQDKWAEYRDKIRADADRLGITLLGLDMVPLDGALALPDQHAKAATPLDVFKQFVQQQNVPGDLVVVGQDILTQVTEASQ